MTEDRTTFAAVLAMQDALVAVNQCHIERVVIGGLQCFCGVMFPGRVPEGWVPSAKDLRADRGYTAEEWATEDQITRDVVIEVTQIRSRTAGLDFFQHQAQEILDELAIINADRVDHQGWVLLPVGRQYRVSRYAADDDWIGEAVVNTHAELVRAVEVARKLDYVDYVITSYRDHVDNTGPWITDWDSRDTRLVE